MHSETNNSFLAVLGKQWLKSLEVFLPKNLTLFFLVTLNAFVKSLTIVLKYFWWLLILMYVIEDRSLQIESWIFPNLEFIKVTYLQSRIPLLIFLASVVAFVIYCAVRPSVLRKTFYYFVGYGWRFWYFLAFVVLLTYFGMFVFQYTPLQYFLAFFFTGTNPFMFLYFSPFVIYFAYFLLDSDGSIKSAVFSVFRAIKMVIYTYPFCLISIVVLWALGCGWSWLMDTIFGGQWIAFPLTETATFLAIVFTACWFNTMYVKRAIEDYTLYF